MADPTPTPLPSGLTHLDTQQGTPELGLNTSPGGPLDLALSGGLAPQQYNPFTMDPTPGSTFDVSRQTTTVAGRKYIRGTNEFITTKTPTTTADTHTVQEFLQGIASTPAALKALQYQLIGAGFNIDATGSLDDKTMSVLSRLIGEAQRDNRSLLDIIDAHAKSQTQAKTKSLATQAQENVQQQLIAAYVSWWGVAPTQQWIDFALKSGQNLFEIEFNEKSKAAYQNSPTYQSNHNNIEGGLAGGALSTQTFTGAGNAFSPGPIA